ncbi:MAG TPA: hypothetical protein VF002_09750 [Gaiellaceae bacterium]
MRVVLVAVVVIALLTAGCGAQSRGRSKGAAAGSLAALLKRPGEAVALVAGDSDFAPGQVRYSFLVIRHNAQAVERPSAEVWLARSRSARPFEQATARLEPIGPPGAGETAAGGVGHIYVVRLEVPRPGTYWLLAEPAGGGIQGLGTLEVKPRSQSPRLGSKAPPSDTPTLASVHGAAARLTTRTPPDLPLLRYSIAGSLGAHAPFVVTFATPRYCTSRTCGPVVDVVEYVRRRFAARGIRFIHVEVFAGNDPQRGYNRWMKQWGLQTEPWTFVVGRDGRIKAKFEGSVSAGELEAALRRFLS